MREISVTSGIELTASEIRKIKQEYFINFQQLELLEEIKEK